MQEKLKDILGNLSPEVDQKEFLLYLQGKLTPDQQHVLEKQILDNEFASDALDGLDALKDKQKLAGLVEQLNIELRNKTQKKKPHLQKPAIKQLPWAIISIVFILILVIISYFIIHRYSQP